MALSQKIYCRLPSSKRKRKLDTLHTCPRPFVTKNYFVYLLANLMHSLDGASTDKKMVTKVLRCDHMTFIVTNGFLF